MGGAAGRAQGVEAGQHQGETNGYYQITAGGRQHALPAVFRGPGLGIVSVSGHGAFGVFMHFGCRSTFEGFGLKNQWRDPEALQQGE
ncbi:hypothetical protein D3C84_1100120 [compost metagenome]